MQVAGRLAVLEEISVCSRLFIRDYLDAGGAADPENWLGIR